MITIDTTRALPRSRSGGSRVLAVVRLIFVNPSAVLFLPLAIMGFIFLINYAIWVIIDKVVQSPADRADFAEGIQYSGATGFIFIYMMVVAIQAITLTFPFAQGYGVTRRDFFFGASVAFVALSLLFSILWTALAAIEARTEGWGVGGRMFTAVYFGYGPWYERFGVFLAGFLFFLFVGAAIAAAYVRWGSTGMYLFFGTTTVLLVAAAGIVTVTGSWPSIGDRIVAAGANGLAWWSLTVTALSAVVGFLVLRRATPRG